MRVRIHRGANEVGGSCIELEAHGERIVLDLGRPITAAPNENVPLPAVSGLAHRDDSLIGLVISHPHIDHYGLAPGVIGTVPVFMGEVAWRILEEASFFTDAPLPSRPRGFLRDRVTFAVRAHRIYGDELRCRANRLVMTFRHSMLRELVAADCLCDAGAVWSMWRGYLDQTHGLALQTALRERSIPLAIRHSSGHASVRDLCRLVDAVAPRRVVPIHSFAGDRYPELFPRVDRQQDGAWWDV
jgi:hypothetical protein